MNTYTFHITPYDLAFLGAIFTGLSFALQLGFAKRINQTANRFLALALLTIVLWLARILGIDIGLSAYIPHWSQLPLQFSLAIGPLIFFYLLKITLPAYKLRPKDLLHFSPLLLELGSHALEVRDSINTGAATYETPAFYLLNPVLQLLVFISVGTYLYKSHRLIERFYRRMKFNGGDRYRYELRWLHNLLIGFGFLWLLWILFKAVDYFYYYNQLGIHFYYPLYLLLVVMVIWIAAVPLFRPETSGSTNPPAFLKPPVPAEMKQRGYWLKKAVQAGRYYQDPELSLNLLAERLELTTHELSKIINTVLKKSFNDFINEFRVAEVARKMEDPAYDHITLLGIAFESGFNSKSTFNRAFRQMTGKSAAEYKNELKKERPSYNLTRHSQSTAIISYRQTIPRWSHEKLNRNFMFKNYLKIAWRNLMRNKASASINITGLSVGMAAFLLILMYVSFELSYDKFHSNADQVYRLNVDIKSANDLMKLSVSSAPMGNALKRDFPEVLEQTRLLQDVDVFKVGDQLFTENRIFFTEPSFFDLFNFPLIKGDPKTALKNPNSVILTETTAKKYFGSADPMGKTIIANGKDLLVVTGIAKDVPAGTQFKFDILWSLSTLAKNIPGRLDQWGNFGNYTFLKLAKGTDASKLQAKFPAFLKRHISEENRKGGQDYTLFLKPLKDIYMDPRGGIEQGSLSNVYIFSFAALFILLIAAINFINLTTARAAERAKEVGVRKVIGAARGQLTIQFLGESVVLCFIAFVFAAALVSVLLPTFNLLSGKTISDNIFEHGYLFILLLISLLIGVLAGAYPALALSAFKPVTILRGKFSSSAKGTWLRKGLVVFQFTISIILMVGTLVVYNQLNFMRNQSLGFEKEHMLTVDFGGADTVLKRYEHVKAEFKTIPGVLAVAVSSGTPGNGSNNAHSELENRQGTMQTLNINMYDVDYDFIKLYGMKIIAGRAFSKDFGTDSTKSIIINEAAAKTLGYTSPNDAIGKRFSQWGRLGQIIGVVKDFHYRSLQNAVDPLNIRINPSGTGVFTIKISAANIPATITAIQNKWKILIPQQPFNYAFLDDSFNKQYAGEERFGKLFLYFAILAIFISCLGLLGLVSYSTMQRTREIGIRKVLGASIFGVVNMLSKEFLQLVLVAILIAFPLSWFGMQSWLKDFAYKVPVSWMVFAAAGLLAFTIAIATVSFQAIKAALANPVKSLKSE